MLSIQAFFQMHRLRAISRTSHNHCMWFRNHPLRISFDLDPLYTPPTTVVNNWIEAPSNVRGKQKFIRPPRDAVRMVNTTNSSIAEAMHTRTGEVKSEQSRHRRMIKCFLRLCAQVEWIYGRLDPFLIQLMKMGVGVWTLNFPGNVLAWLELTIIQIGSLFDAVDIDGSGDLSIDEFVDAITGTVGRDVCDLVTAVGNSDKWLRRGA